MNLRLRRVWKAGGIIARYMVKLGLPIVLLLRFSECCAPGHWVATALCQMYSAIKHLNNTNELMICPNCAEKGLLTEQGSERKIISAFKPCLSCRLTLDISFNNDNILKK